jgi:Flp pilus assembly protein TadG
VNRAPRDRSRGQSLAEFAIVFPVMMLIIAGIIQFGIIFWGQNTLNQVARDTGRWAATQQSCTPATESAIRNTANAIAGQSALIGYVPGTWTAANVTVSWTGTPCPPQNNQETAWVKISIDHTVPIFFPWVPGNGNIGTSTEFRMEPAP